MTEYFGPEQAFFRSASVCMCLCLSVTTFYLNTIQPIFMKRKRYTLTKKMRLHFYPMYEMLLYDAMVVILHVFDCGNLTVATLLGSTLE